MTTKNDCVHADQDPELEPSRRKFLERLTFGLAGLIGLMMVLPGLGYVLAPLVRTKPNRWRGIGKLDTFKIGDTVLVSYEDPSPVRWAGVTAKSGAWVRRESDNKFVAFSINCRHLGCPVRWVNDAGLFMCPCHGGVYYKDGTVAGGPPPEPLYRMPIRIREDEVEIETQPQPLTSFDDSLS